MYRRYHCFLFFFLCCISTAALAQVPPIGQWREHLNYQQAIQVIGGNKIYCATTQALFAIDNKDQVQRFSKVTGLNDIGVRCIGWNDKDEQLVVAYQNSNIDVIKDNTVKNIGDITRSTITGDKRIQQIYCQNGTAYLSSGLGIILADLVRYEISATWVIGQNGAALRVNAFARNNHLLYAATDDGLKVCPTSSNPADHRNWSPISSLPAGTASHVMDIDQNRMLVKIGNNLFIGEGQQWQFLYGDPAWPILNINFSNDRLLVCERANNGMARVSIIRTNGSIERILQEPGIISMPLAAILVNDQSWVADLYGGLSRFSNKIERFIPNGPPGIATGQMMVHNGSVWAAAGSVNEAWNYLFNRDGIFRLYQDQWSFTGYNNLPILDSVLDFVALAPDTRNGSLWAGSFGGGLVRFWPNQRVQIFKNFNSSLQEAIGDPGNIRVSGLAFDSRNQLWISNYGAAKPLSVRLAADSSWHNFQVPFSLTENALAQIVPDDMDQLWILGAKGNGVICYSPGNNPTNTNDDAWKHYRTGLGNGNLPSLNALCLAKDKDGSIWIGTDKGIGIIRCSQQVFSGSGCDAIQPIVQQDRFAGLLFGDERVQAIAVDGANRKWIGTRNGIWLISPQGDKIIYRFTAENSPLLGNDVRQLAIDGNTGELFIGTTEGICSFRSTATDGKPVNTQVQVFPNPVPPGYRGNIAIRGLVNNALVKIAELNGRLVYQTRALGGQAIWNGRHYTGTPVASGVYLVIIRDDSGMEHIATRIVFTGR